MHKHKKNVSNSRKVFVTLSKLSKNPTCGEILVLLVAASIIEFQALVRNLLESEKGMFNNHVDRKGWVDGQKFVFFVHV